MPIVSVIVPVYKVEPYLRRCVDSILAQTFTDFELILVDDGSPDNSGAICDEYTGKDPRVRVIHQNNGGPSNARNAGLRVACGEYLYFCDSDDFIEKTLFEDASVYMPMYDVVLFNWRRVNEVGVSIGQETDFHPGVIEWIDVKDKQRFLQGPFFYPRIVGWEVANRFFRKSIIDRYNISFVERIDLAEDLYFCFCYLLHANSLVCLDGVYYNYTVRSDSIMGVEKTRYNIGKMNELGKALLKHILEYEDSDSAGLCFPIAYLGVMDHVIKRIRRNNPMISVPRLRNIIQSDIGDPSFFLEQINQLSDHRNELREAYGWCRAKVHLAEYQYYADGKILLYCFRALPWKLYSFAARCVRKIGRLIKRAIQRTEQGKE